MILAPPPPLDPGDTNLTIYLDDRERGHQILKYKKMTTFSFYSFRFLKISPYINFKNFWAEFWRPPPGDARGQMPPPAPPLATPLLRRLTV